MNQRTKGLLLARAFAPSRTSFAKVLELLTPHGDTLVSEWLQKLRGLGLSAEEIAVIATVELPVRAASLRRMKFDSLRHKLQLLGKSLAACSVQLDHVIAALNLLFEICLTYLVQETPEGGPLILAMMRFQHLAEAVLVSAYLQHREANEHTLETKLTEAEQRLHGASAYVTDVYENERRRLSQDLHDDIGHHLMLLKLYLELMVADADKGDLSQLRPRLQETLSLSGRTIDAVRRLALDLGPAILEELGFVPAIRSYVRQFSARAHIRATVQEGAMPSNVPSTHQIALYRILQGALSNVLKHSKAKSVKVALGSMKDSVLVMIIEDDGIGFDPAALPPRQSFGLTAMRERIGVLGGRFHVQSAPAGLRAGWRGTRIEVDLPLPSVGRK